MSKASRPKIPKENHGSKNCDASSRGRFQRTPFHRGSNETGFE
jgi:hypothetical protein